MLIDYNLMLQGTKWTLAHVAAGLNVPDMLELINAHGGLLKIDAKDKVRRKHRFKRNNLQPCLNVDVFIAAGRQYALARGL